MFAAIGRFFASLTRLADSLDALSTTTAEVNARLRSQLGLDAPADPPRVLESRADVAEADAGGKPARNGRARDKAAV